MLARLRLGERIGRGGMAEVFAAQLIGPAGFMKDVAVKRLLPRYAKDPVFLERFLAEARLAARLSHPNVVQIFELGHDGQDHYIVMEAVRGKSLRAVEQRLIDVDDRMPLGAALHVALGLCAGLAHAHELFSIVHRDVSPHNVLLSYDGAVKLIDFGIARARDDDRLTRDGQVIGKLRYMSPEQVRGDALDARSDVFAAGAVVYEMVTGRLPFDGRNEVEIAERIERGQRAPVRAVAPHVEPRIAAAIERALAPELAQRFESARAFGAALAAASVAPAPSAHDVEALLRRLYPDEDSTGWPVLDARTDGAEATATGALREISISSDISGPRGDGDPGSDATLLLERRSAEHPRAPGSSRRWFVAGIVAAASVGGAAAFVLARRAGARDAPATPDAGAARATEDAGPPSLARDAPVDAGGDAAVRVVVEEEAEAAADAGTVRAAEDSGAQVQKVAAPRKRFGKLVIETRPWTEVSVDGRVIGVTPLSRDVPVGRHRVSLVAEGGLKRDLDVVVRAGETTTLRIDLRK